MKHRQASTRSERRQHGAVALVLALSLTVLIGFAGLAIDLGRFFVIKSELQNAMDACVLAAVSQLRPGQGDTAALSRARSYGQLAASRNRVNFQAEVPVVQDAQITFSDRLDFSTGADYNSARYVKCEYPLSGLSLYFMNVLNPARGNQTISAFAVAGLSAKGTACAVPVGVCKGSGPNLGLQTGEWIEAKTGTSLGKGYFGWLDFTKQGGGKTELVEMLKGSGQCNLSEVVSVDSSLISPGNKTSVDEAWNSRFGWYDKLTLAEAPPDYTGYAYSKDMNWPSGKDAYANYQTAKAGYLSYQGLTPKDIENAPGYKQYTAATLNALNTQSRRIVTAPVIDCSDLSKTMAVEAWSCVLMLNPMISAGNPKNPFVWDIAKVEYLGLATDANSPCARLLPVMTQ